MTYSQVYCRDRKRRDWLVQTGRACHWRPWRDVTDAIRKAGL